jgi:hypothetical protein
MHVPQMKKRENEMFLCFGVARRVECRALKERPNFGSGRAQRVGEFAVGEVRLSTDRFT